MISGVLVTYALVLEMGQSSLNSTIKSLDINPLHELEPLHQRILNRNPPDRPRIVDKDVKHGHRASSTSTACPSIQPINLSHLGSLIHHSMHAFKVSCIDSYGRSLATSFLDLALDGADGGLLRIGVWGEGLRYVRVARGLCCCYHCRNVLEKDL